MRVGNWVGVKCWIIVLSGVVFVDEVLKIYFFRERKMGNGVEGIVRTCL